MYVYIISEKPCADNDYNTLYTVGFYDPAGKWHPDSDHEDREIAAERVAFLNGGPKPDSIDQANRKIIEQMHRGS